LPAPDYCGKRTINPCCFWVPMMYKLPSAGSERKAVLWGRKHRRLGAFLGFMTALSHYLLS
jgi:hypothetical protein